MKKQQGVVLILCLVILLVVTLLGVTAMQGSGLQMKMVSDYSSRQQVFEATEAALRSIESSLQDTPYSSLDFDSDVCAAGTSTCFENTCAGGLCFFGRNIGDQDVCTVYDGPGDLDSYAPSIEAPDPPIWLNATYTANWQTLGGGSSDMSLQYMIEFRCFVDAGVDLVEFNNGHALYRVTTLGTDSTGNVQVMLQSTLSVDIP